VTDTICTYCGQSCDEWATCDDYDLAICWECGQRELPLFFGKAPSPPLAA